jgi:hypothetical protein
MSLDNNPVSVKFALDIATKYYQPKTYFHAVRVADYVIDNKMIPSKYKEDCVILAIMHDLIEDTEYDGNGLPENIYRALELLSKPKDMDYIEYIKNIKNTQHISWRECAYWVKIADIKDHLSQRETLTDRLKNKYLDALAYLL